MFSVPTEKGEPMIAIPNMSKPKRCELCPCSYYSEGALSDICQVTNKPITDGTPNNCPLIEIVTCRECKWWNKGFCNNGRADANLKLDKNCFCDEGERRADDVRYNE